MKNVIQKGQFDDVERPVKRILALGQVALVTLADEPDGFIYLCTEESGRWEVGTGIALRLLGDLSKVASRASLIYDVSRTVTPVRSDD